MAEAKVHPVEFKLERKSRLEIRWSDERRSVISLVELRKACPCADCRQAREERASNPLAVMKPGENAAEMALVRSAELAGNYGLKIVWEDGHSTGIYDFGMLRRLSS